MLCELITGSLNIDNFIKLRNYRFSLLVDPTWTLLGNVSCVTAQNLAVKFFTMGVNGVYDFPVLEIGDFFGINTHTVKDPFSGMGNALSQWPG